MHIVVLTGSYYPYLMPPAACIKPYLDELAKNNNVEVIAPSTDSRFVKSVICDGVKVVYINNFTSRVFAYIETNLGSRPNSLYLHFLKLVFKGYRYVKLKLAREPYDTSLISQYVSKLHQLHINSPIDVVISVTFPFYTHAAALKFKQKMPNIRWITYTTDPLAYSEANPIEKYKLKFAKKIESQIYNLCDKCIITEELLPNLTEDYLVTRNKIVTLPYLLKELPLNMTKTDYSRPIILYAGYVFIRVRNPQKMLSVFSSLNKFELRLFIAGDRHCRRILRAKYPNHIKINGLVSRQEYYQLLVDADVLLLLSNDAKLQAPSKLMELISTGKPIINFYYHKDTSYNLIEKYPLGLNISNSDRDQDIVYVLNQFIKDNYHKRLSKTEINKLYPDRLLSTQMPLFIEALL